MSGSVIRKRGRYYPVTRVRRPDGSYRQEYHGGYPTKREALAVLNDVVHRVNRGAYVTRTDATVATYLHDRWLPTIAPTLRPSTYESYRTNVSCHIVPALGEAQLQQLTAADLNGFYAQLLSSGRRDGAGLAPKTVLYIHGIVRKALADAVDDGMLVHNVAAKAKPPKVGATKVAPMSTWTASELKRFYDHVRADRLFAAWRLAGSTGMRRGELLGLRWHNVDFNTARVAIRETLLSVNYGVIAGDAKTVKGVRVVDLDPVTVAALRAHKVAQAEERLVWGGPYVNEGFVFCREDGTPLHPDLFSQTFRRHVKGAGLTSIRLHDLRHTHATLALKAGVPVKVISERLGHADVAFTMNSYAHALPGMQAEAAALVAALVDG